MTRTPDPEPDVPSVPRWSRWLRSAAGWIRRLGPRRALFLDDDPARAERFLLDHPRAVWVTNVPDCLARLAERWHEVHLDHDLGGRTFVDSAETDCGMEVIRWLCREPRPHLKRTRFFVHTHNATAGLLMVLLMQKGGYRAEFRPFGLDLAKLLAHNEPGAGSAADPGRVGWWGTLRRWAAVRPGPIATRTSGAVHPVSQEIPITSAAQVVEFGQPDGPAAAEGVVPGQTASAAVIQPPPTTSSS